MDIDLRAGEHSCGIFDSTHSFPGIYVTEPRRLVNYEIELYTENGGTTYLDGVPHQIRRGAVLCAPPGSVRYSELPLRTYYLKLSTDAVSLVPVVSAFDRWFQISDCDKGEELILAMLRARAEDKPLLEYAKLLEFLGWLTEESDRAKSLLELDNPKKREAVSRAMAYMEANFKQSCTLAEIAAHVHLSPVYFHGLFQRAVGKTPCEYMTRLRVEEAKRLLLTAGISISRVSEASGFSTQSYFNHVFRARVGVTPREYRRQMLTGYFDVNGIFKESEKEHE